MDAFAHLGRCNRLCYNRALDRCAGRKIRAYQLSYGRIPLNTLHIRLFGGFSVTLDDRPVTDFRSAKARALLAYLAAQPDQDHLRPKLATICLLYTSRCV